MKRLEKWGAALLLSLILILILLSTFEWIPGDVRKGGNMMAPYAFPVTFYDIVDQESKYENVVLATVTKKKLYEEYNKEENRLICYSIVTVEVEEELRGSGKKTLQYMERGGVSREGWEHHIPTVTRVEVGDQIILASYDSQTSRRDYYGFRNFNHSELRIVRREKVLLWPYLLPSNFDPGEEDHAYYHDGVYELPVERYLQILRDGMAWSERCYDYMETVETLGKPKLEAWWDEEDSTILHLRFTAPEELPDWIRTGFRLEVKNLDGSYSTYSTFQCVQTTEMLYNKALLQNSRGSELSFRLVAILGEVESEAMYLTVPIPDETTDP